MLLQAVAQDVEVEDEEDMRQHLWQTVVSSPVDHLKQLVMRPTCTLNMWWRCMDPQVEEDPTMEGEREMETSFGKVANESSGHHELWFIIHLSPKT